MSSMFFLSYVIAVFSVLCFVFAGLLFFKRHGDARAVYLALLTLCAGAWALGNAEADVASSGTAVIGWTLIASFGFVFTATFFLCFVASFKRQGSLSLPTLLLLCGPSSILYALIFNPLMLEQSISDPVVFGYMPSQVSFGLSYMLFALFIHILFAVGIISLLRFAIQATSPIRLQATYIIIGATVVLVGSALFDVVLPLLGEGGFYNIGPLSTGIMIGCLSYAIVRHQLLDIRIIVQKGLVYTGLLSVIIAAYVATLDLISLFPGVDSILAAPLSAGIVTVVGIFTVPVIERYFRRVTDSIFFKDRYDYADILERLSEVLHRNVEFDAMAAEVREVLDETFHPETINLDDTGALSLGPKRSGDIYTGEDNRLLTTFVHQAATAFERAKLFTQVKQYAAELEGRVVERTKQLQEIQEKQTRMMLDISHGLQTPLAVFQIKLEQLKHAVPDDKDIQKFETSLADLSNFIYNLLKLARLESKEEEVNLVPMSLTSLLRAVVEEVETITATHDISIRQNTAPDIYVMGDAKKIREVVMNLSSNSIKYMRPDSKKEIAFSLTTEGAVAVLSVSDSGVGIVAEDMLHIFERFYRVPHSPGRINGNGLGLAISKHIIEQHGGTIAAESELGKGTTITIRFPLI